MADVVLVQPPIEDFYLTAKRTVPYGLALIAAGLERAGFSVAIIDGLATGRSRVIPRPREFDYLDDYYGRPDISPFALFHHYRHFGYSFEHLARLVREENPFLVGISSLFTPYYGMTRKTAAAIRKICPEAWIVVGGHHATVMPEQVMEAREVDFVIRGEGEEAVPELAGVLSGFKRGEAIPGLEKVAGLVCRRPGGGMLIKPPAVVNDLALQPPPATHLIKRSYYRRRGRGAIVSMASRGCPFACSYCAVNRDSWQPYRRRPAAAVLAEITSELDSDEIGFIDFEDENLSLEREWFVELLEGLRELRRGREFELRAMNGLFPPSLDDELLQLMAAAGFKTLNLAVASFDCDRLKLFRRPDVAPAHARILESSVRLGLDAVSYLVAAAPGQQAASSLDDLLRLFRLPTIIGLSIFYPAPGSLEYERAAARGLLPEELSRLRSSALPLDQEGCCSRQEAATLLRLSRIANFIKLLKREKIPLPAPCSYPARPALPPSLPERTARGFELLSWFLADGRIRGLTPGGEVYEHVAAAGLCERFRRGI